MNKPKNRDKDIVVQEFANEILIYDLKTNKAYCLNETSAMIWHLCDGTKTVAGISKSLSEKLKQSLTEDVIWLALDGFKKDNLLEENEQFAINFNGLNRRQVIKKIGFASMIALPLISSIVAPNAAAAQSGLSGLRGSCTTNANCDSSAPNCSGYLKSCCIGAGGVNGFTGAYFDTGQGLRGCSFPNCSASFNCVSYEAELCCSGSQNRVCPSPDSCACVCS